MTKRVPAMTARKNFGELLESVFYRGDEIVVERAGKAMGVLIPVEQYRKLEQQRNDALARMETLWAAAPVVDDADDAERDILTETQVVRHEAFAETDVR